MVKIIYMMIAVVLTMGTVFTLWGSTLIKEKLNATENITPAEICTSASFKFYSGKYDKANMNLYLVLENQRSVELKLEKLYIFYPNNFETFDINKTLEGNILKSFNIPGVKDGFSSGTVKTNCPDIETDFSYSQLT